MIGKRESSPARSAELASGCLIPPKLLRSLWKCICQGRRSPYLFIPSPIDQGLPCGVWKILHFWIASWVSGKPWPTGINKARWEPHPNGQIFQCQLNNVSFISCLDKHISRMTFQVRFECKTLRFLRFSCLIFSPGQDCLQRALGRSTEPNLWGVRQFHSLNFISIH